MRRLALGFVTLAALALTVPMIASAASVRATAATTGDTHQGVVHVSVDVNKFFATAAGTAASGTATATITPLGQAPTTVKQTVRLAASSSGKCSILTLTLEKLELKLLGLEVNLEKVVLTVTGESHGGVLGSLFCSLAKAKVKAGRVAEVARINAAIRRHGAVRPIAFSTAIRAQTAAAPGACPILNLVLGPLHLDLVGLVVDLNQVHLTINAEPNGGVLGSLFCGLANTKI